MRIALTLISVFSGMVFLSNKGGRNQPTTGAPFENSAPACAECHSGGSYQPTIALTLKDSLGNVVSGYKPNSTYTLEMQLGSSLGAPKSYGFQAVLVDETGVQAGSFVALGEKVRKLTLQNKVYLTQISPLESGLFTAKWQAPATEKSLTLYIAGLATNSNNNTSGDKGTFTSFDIQPQTTSTDEAVTEEDKIFTNGDFISWQLPAEKAALYDVNGSLLQQSSGTMLEVPMGRHGMYILVLTRAGKSQSYKLIL